MGLTRRQVTLEEPTLSVSIQYSGPRALALRVQFPECLHCPQEVTWWLRRKVDAQTGCRVDKGQFRGVQQRAPDFEGITLSVGGVAQDRGVDGSEVHPNLVGSPGIKIAPEQRGSHGFVPGFQNFVMCSCFSAFFSHGHFGPRATTSTDRRVNCACRGFGSSTGNDQITAAHGPRPYFFS